MSCSRLHLARQRNGGRNTVRLLLSASNLYHLNGGLGLTFKSVNFTMYIFENSSTLHALRYAAIAVCCTKEKTVTVRAL